MLKALNLLLLEDEPSDAELTERELRKAGVDYVCRRVQTREAFTAALSEAVPDLILADFHLPAFDGMEALRIAQKSVPGVPFIFISGKMGEDFAIETLHQGAADYVLKGHLSKLGPAVMRALQVADERRWRKEADQALQESAERFSNMTESAQDGIVILNDDGLITFWNAAAERLFGYPRQEMLGRDMHHIAAPPRYHEAIEKGWPLFRTTGQGAVVGATIEAFGLRRDGSEFPMELSISSAQVKGRWHAIGIIRDISERKRAELALQRSNRFLRTLSRCNETLIHAAEENRLLQDMCRLIVEVGEFPLAWVGYTGRDNGEAIRVMAHFGAPGQALIEHHIADWSDEQRAACPMYRAMGTGQRQVAQDIAGQAGCAPCQLRAAESGYGSSVSLPLLGEGGVVLGALSIYAREAWAFGQEELAIFDELAGDLAFGVVTLRQRAEQEENARRLERAMEDTIQAIATTIEARDPYTAGHQRRVVQLAAAIAEELGLPERRITGVRRGAEIHDIGKIYIPAEILSRPGRLNPVEFNLIQMHPQVGFDIIKDIDFPWPVGEMILQHHERLDGSGYPHGLRGDDIVLEARIIAVADVVDAMITHRPYRAALGQEVALQEIERNRGRLYDAAVVDACLRLFRDKGFAFQ
jgi:PAS domain S-box-containing protein